MSRLLWLGNPPWSPSGYGEQAALFLPRLVEQGHEVAVLCNHGLQGRETKWNGITCYPSDGIWGNANLGTFVAHTQAEQVIALCDAWVLAPDSWPDELEAAVWAPVDHWPIPPAVLGVLRHERIRPIAMSEFGLEQMRTFQLEDALYIPHAVDTELFRPQPQLRAEIRDELGIDRDCFLVGMVAANQGNPNMPRKSFPQAFLAFAELARRHDDAWLYVHTEAKPRLGSGGIALDTLAEITQCPVGRVRFPHAEAFHLGIPRQALAYTYAAFDVLLMLSMGEGFGIPLIEAQASGVPVITSDHSAMTELCGSGWLVGGDPYYDEAQTSFFIAPHVALIVQALEAAYANRGSAQLAERARAFALSYDVDRVAEAYWRPALEQLLAPTTVVEKTEAVA